MCCVLLLLEVCCLGGPPPTGFLANFADCTSFFTSRATEDFPEALLNALPKAARLSLSKWPASLRGAVSWSLILRALALPRPESSMPPNTVVRSICKNFPSFFHPQEESPLPTPNPTPTLSYFMHIPQAPILPSSRQEAAWTPAVHSKWEEVTFLPPACLPFIQWL